MIDPLGDRLALANPVPAAAVGGLRLDASRVLVDDITGRRERPRRPSRRRLVVALLIALAVAAPVAFAATETHLLDFALGSPAPKKVQKEFEHMLLPAYGPNEGPPQWRTRNDIIRGSERLVAQTTTSTGGVAHLYAVRLRGGGACWFAIGKPFGGGGCGGRALHRKSTIGGSIGMLYAGMGKRQSGTFGQGVTYYGPVGARGTTSLRMTFKDGTVASIPVHDGWFMYEVPLAQTFWGHEPVLVEALDASGRVLAKVTDPLGLHPPKLPPLEQALKPHVLLAREPLGWKGASLELLMAKGSRGNECIQGRNTGDLFRTRRWLCDAAVGRDSAITIELPHPQPQPVYAEWHRSTRFGQQAGYVYAFGWAGPPVATVEIRYQDSSVQRIPLHRRLFIYVVPRSHFAPGRRPSYLVGLNAGGRVVYRRFLYPSAHCTYPGPDPACAQTVNSG